MTYEPLEIDVGGATLVGDRWNGAGATIALLHAGVCDRRCWREVGARLGAAGRDVVAPGRAHLPYLEAPDEIAALIMAEVSP
jgi:hypothetical protein